MALRGGRTGANGCERDRMRLLIWGIFILLGVLVVPGALPAAGADIAVITRQDYPSKALSLQELKEIYLGEKQYEGRVKINPVDQRDMESIKSVFLKKVLNKEIKNYKGYWLMRVFKEGIIPPAIKNSPQGVVETILAKRGSIGYVWAQEVEAEAKGKDLKILLTIPVED